MKLTGDIGSFDWTRRTRGLLGRGERARFFAATVLLEIRSLPDLVTAFRGKGRNGPDPSVIGLPDSALSREVIERCESELAPSVVAHSLRSFVFARALGIADRLAVDEEELFVATMYHDLGFAQIDELTDRCFTLPAAEEALDQTRAAGWSRDRGERVADAITRHINPFVPVSVGEVQNLTQAGVYLDIFSLRHRELSRKGIQRVFEAHPRSGFNADAADRLEGHGGRVAGCRARTLVRAGAGLCFRLAPD